MSKILSPEEIAEAKALKEKGMTKRQLARYFEVGSTTIWDNVFGTRKRYPKSLNQPTFRNLKSITLVIHYLKCDGYTSIQVSQRLNIPLQDVNYIWTKNI